MYYDLYLPYPVPLASEDVSTKKSKKGKGKAPAPLIAPSGKDCWDGLEKEDREAFSRKFALLGHLGYTVAGLTVYPGEPSNQVHPSPFQTNVPYPDCDPRFASSSTAVTASTAGRPPMVQITRLHIRLDDGKAHCLTAQNTMSLRNYDILSVAPTTEKSFQLACTDLSNPGPNQISIVTLPLHERAYTFRFNRKQMRQAQRNGVVFELLYATALFPPTSTSQEIVRRYRQNFLSNAREVVRITGGKGIIFSSGPGAENSLRGCLDVVNLGTLIGMPANLAKDAVDKTPKMVLLRAQARKTFKAIMNLPSYAAPLEEESTDGLKRHVEGKGETVQLCKKMKAS